VAKQAASTSQALTPRGRSGGPKLKPKPPPDARALIPTSIVLQRLHDEAPTDHFTLGWLTGNLRKRSFGIIMLLLALVAIAPGVSVVAGLLLMIPAFQMIAGQPAPVFPRRIATRPLPTRHLAALVQRAVPVLRYLEKMIYPRWPTPLEATKRLVGIIVVILNTIVVWHATTSQLSDLYRKVGVSIRLLISRWSRFFYAQGSGSTPSKAFADVLISCISLPRRDIN
jgi:hypothetical protein